MSLQVCKYTKAVVQFYRYDYYCDKKFTNGGDCNSDTHCDNAQGSIDSKCSASAEQVKVAMDKAKEVKKKRLLRSRL